MGTRRKMLVSGLCLTACLLATNVPQAYALNDTTSSAVQGDVELYMTYINDADCTFSISNGTAKINAWVRGQSGNSTKCQIVVNLQEKSGLSWKTVQTWSDTRNGRKATVNASQKVTSGKSYRVTATVTVWNGSKSESKPMTSNPLTA
ncbi:MULTISPECIES: hypothetical protein [Agathobaculum]|uniref:hypothetical protein n=1 Tax=Agathobaculum TaxID=2048137 RepID=UPI003F927B30